MGDEKDILDVISNVFADEYVARGYAVAVTAALRRAGYTIIKQQQAADRAGW